MRVYFQVVFLFLSLMFTSCKQKDKPPIDDAKMEKLLVDIGLAEAYATLVNDSLHKQRDKNMDSLAVYYQAVLKHHSISLQQFQQALDWYKKHPRELDSLYNRVLPVYSSFEADLKGK
jgi:hypothetical protein